MVKSVIDGRECGFLNSAGGMESGRLVLQVGFGLKTGFLGVCAFVPFFAISRTFKQKHAPLCTSRGADVRAGFRGLLERENIRTLRRLVQIWQKKASRDQEIKGSRHQVRRKKREKRIARLRRVFVCWIPASAPVGRRRNDGVVVMVI